MSAELWVIHSDEFVSKPEIVAELLKQIDAEAGTTLRHVSCWKHPRISFPGIHHEI
jgi:hypothetical protein